MDDRHSVYRQIRAQRTYRTLGKMSWWRIVLGIIFWGVKHKDYLSE